MKCVDASEVYAITIGTAGADRLAAALDHCSRCPRCAGLLAEVQEMVGRLGFDQGELDRVDLTGRVMSRIRQGQARPVRPAVAWWEAWRASWGIPLAAAATAAALVAVVVVRGGAPEHSPYQARGGAASSDQWVSIRAHRAVDGRHRPVTDSIWASDALAFTYLDRSSGQWHYLMVFAVDHSGRVFWYYPAHLRETDNPTSVPISGSGAPERLPDQVRHALHPGKLRVFGVFSRQSLDVRGVEAAIARDLASVGSIDRLPRLHIPGTGQHSFLLDVKAGHNLRVAP